MLSAGSAAGRGGRGMDESAAVQGQMNPGTISARDDDPVRPRQTRKVDHGSDQLLLRSSAIVLVLAIFVAGLMVGRTPEYVGKKIEAREVKMAMLAILVLPLMYLGWTAVAVVYPTAVASMA